MPPSTDHAVDQYARAVVAGELPAGKYHRLACTRHLRNREQARVDPAYPFVFDPAAADRFFRFAAKLRHYKGKQWAGRPIELSDCQRFRLGSVFGWRVTATGLRRFTTSYNELPRKQGKSLEAALVALYVTFFEGEMGAEGYCIATKEAQARIVFNDCKKLVKSSGLKTRIRVLARNLHREDTSSKLEPLGSDSESTDGLNPSLIINDEFHAQKNRGLIDVMESATGARLNPLNFQITTAGDDPVSPCGDQHDYATKILEQVLEPDASTESFFAFIAHADPEDDPFVESTWRKANPHYGGSVNPEDILKLALKAQKMPSAAAEFKQKRLNLWVNATAPCLSVEGWRRGQSALAREAFEASLEHETCYAGVDLASKIDLCALSLVFPPTPGRPKWAIIQRIWSPKDTLADRAHRDRAPYQVWADKGWLLTPEGVQINHRVVVDALLWARERYDIELVGFDAWHADKVVHDLKDEGFADEHLIAVPQTYQGMSAACLRMQAEVLEANVDANSCPVTAWAASNVVGQRDGKDNLMFAKGKSRGRIDPVIAATIAQALWLKQPPAPTSVYLTRGVLSLDEY